MGFLPFGRHHNAVNPTGGGRSPPLSCDWIEKHRSRKGWCGGIFI
jgi:hypothetical protein